MSNFERCILNLSTTNNVRFSQTSLSIFPITFIHGRNGSGKSTLVDECQKQLAEDFDVHVFNGFEGVVSEDEQLNAVALGSENSAIQSQIDAIQLEVGSLRSEISEDGKLTNALRKANDEHLQCERKLKRAFRESAKEIKDSDAPRISKTSYNATDFKQDWQTGPSTLQEDSQRGLITKALETQLPPPSEVVFPEVDLASLLDRVNEILGRSINQTVHIEQLDQDSEKRSFADKGRKIHSCKDHETCAFCGNEIPLARWQELDGYFSRATDNLNADIQRTLTSIAKVREQIEQLTLNSSEEFYSIFRHEYQSLSEDISKQNETTRRLLDECTASLQKRAVELYTTLPLIDTKSTEWIKIYEECGRKFADLVERNKIYANEIETEKQKAKKELRLGKVAQLAKDTSIPELDSAEKTARAAREFAQLSWDSTHREIDNLEARVERLREEMKNEHAIADAINADLAINSVGSFALEHTQIGESGYYYIKDPDTGELRNVTQLSTGEKNIIAFLYFMKKCKATTDPNKPQMIILDDPMTSNDDLYQYIILAEISLMARYIDKNPCKRPQTLILLTHNMHFYLNALPYGKDSYPQGWGVYNFQKNGKESVIKRILCPYENYQTAYSSLWSDLVFAYKKNKPNLMWNTFRRILGTYLQFNGHDISAVVNKEAEKDRRFGFILKKYMDVNSHELLDFETESNRASVTEIKDYIRCFFRRNNNDDHFKKLWKHGERSSSN